MTDERIDRSPIEPYVRRLERVGAGNVNYIVHDYIKNISVDFDIVPRDPGTQIKSSAEFGSEFNFRVAELRLPTVKSTTEDKGFENFKAINESVMDILADVFDIEVYSGVSQVENIFTRAQHGSDYKRLTFHIILEDYNHYEVGVSNDQLVEVVGRLHDMWNDEFFYLNETDRIADRDDEWRNFD